MTTPATRTWGPYDDALLDTLGLLASFERGSAVASLPTPFRPGLAADEQVLRSAPFQLLGWQAPGDGNYAHDSSFFFATGGVGLAATAGIAGARALGNSRRRREAQLNAQPRWLPVDAGQLFVSSHGFYWQTAQGLYPTPWTDVLGAQMGAPGLVTLQLNENSWQVHSFYAELLFVLWAVAVHPAHPSLANRDWLPAGWLEWARVITRDSPERQLALPSA